MYLFTSETARTRAHVSTIAKPETLKRSMFDIPTSEEKRIKKFQAELERMKNMNDIVESIVSNRDQFGKVVKQFNSSGPDDSGFFSISTENRK